MSIPIAGPGNGLVFATTSYRMVSTEAASYGDCFVVDLSSVDSSTGFFNTMSSTEAASGDGDAEYALVGLCMESGGIAAGGEGMWMFRGNFANAVTSDTVAVSDFLAHDDVTDDLTTSTGAGDKVVAFALTASSGGVIDVIFDGLNGFGTKQ